MWSPIWESWPDVYYCLTVRILFLWGALSDERTGLSFVYAAGPCQRSVFLIRVPWYSRPYFTLSDLRLPFSSPPTTRRVTVGVFDPRLHKSTRLKWLTALVITSRHGPHRKHHFSVALYGRLRINRNCFFSVVAKQRVYMPQLALIICFISSISHFSLFKQIHDWYWVGTEVLSIIGAAPHVRNLNQWDANQLA
jgi:hypothetical protein